VPIKITALILARGGSKGIPLKNLARVGNKTLLGNAIERLLHFGQFDNIWVSTDHPDIAAEAERFAVNVHWRSKESASDTATSIEAVQEFLQYHPEIARLALVQCTSVFIEQVYLAKAAQLAQQPDVDCLFAAWRSHKLRWTDLDGKVAPLNFDPKHRPRRQDWNGELIESGMFYIAKRQLLESGVFQNER
jgi:N-acylneuraminate/3-deoxy-D-glycero-D-galacto-nononate cytidylyltransferase